MNDKKILEAALFATGRALGTAELAELIGRSSGEVSSIMQTLIEEYKTRDTALELIKINDKYLIQIKQKYTESVEKIAPKDLSTPVLRTLSVIAYHQPITQSDVIGIRGNKAYSHISELEGRGLIVSTKKGRTNVISTTDAFLEYFELNKNAPETIKKMFEAKISSP
ncbi:MAG TPA: SMC-Scp complex subunit ScpB [Methanocellales archaeon]|nr:SMC-Scp complex subunit ScpB [Methanocellales archaeon]